MRKAIVVVLVFSFIRPSICFSSAAAQRSRQKKIKMHQKVKMQHAVKQQTQALTQQMADKAAKEIAGQTAAQQAVQQPVKQAYAGPVTEIDANKIWGVLERSSQVWTQLLDVEAKVFIVSGYINSFQESGIKIKKGAAHYASMIDDMSRQSPDILKNPFRKVLQLVAIMEYDFGNGQNPDTLARKILSEEAYRQNRKRLGGN